MIREVRRLRLGPDDQIAARYLAVPFELGGEGSLEVRLAYDPSTAVVDLGCEGPDGWRGWSGGARSRFVLTEGAATPGYLPGPLAPGRWAVVLGLHVVPAGGVDVVVEVTAPATAPVEADPAAPPPVRDRPRGSARRLPAGDGLTWWAGDFHAHTLHSDGALGVTQLAAQAAEQGLDLLAVTDHNTTSHHASLPATGSRYGLQLLPGQEVTTARGHANAFGDVGWVDFRRPADTWVEQVEERGGVLSVNHPQDGDCSWQHPLARRPHALEVWHASWFRDLTATSPWALWPLWGLDAVPLGGSDFHRPGHRHLVGTPTTWVAAPDPSPGAVLDALRAGRTAITRGVGGPALVRAGGDLVALDADGAVLVDVDGRRRAVRGPREALAADDAGPRGAGRAPYRLEAADRTLLAISP